MHDPAPPTDPDRDPPPGLEAPSGDGAPPTGPAVGAHADAASGSEAGSDADRLTHEPATTCLNCGAVLPGRFCPDCGQKDQPIRQPAHVFIAESVSEYFGLDGRLWRSLGLLLFAPGALTEAYLEGRRTRYLRPLRLYLTATVLFFFLLSFRETGAAGFNEVHFRPVAADTTLTAEALGALIGRRETVAEAELDATRAALAIRLETAFGDTLRQREAAFEALEARLDSTQDALYDLDDDSLIAVSSLDRSVVEALGDSGFVRTPAVGTLFGEGIWDRIPAWAKGDLARRLEETNSPAERQLLLAQYQRAVLRQVPTALFLVLPLFALLLKVLYLSGGGRAKRLRRRPAAPGVGVSPWRRAAHRLSLARWRLTRWRASRRLRKRRTAWRKASRRPVRGLWRRSWRRVQGLEALRPWRVRRIRMLRRAYRSAGERYYAEHLVFALHVHAFTFVVFTVLLGVGFEAGRIGSGGVTVGGLLVAAIPIYFLLAQRRVYGQTWFRTLAKATALGVTYTLVVALGALAAGALALRLG